MGIFISSLLSLISLPLLILSSIVFVRFPEFACTYVHEKKRVESEEKWGKKGRRVEKSCRNNRRFEGVKYACAVNMAYYYSRRGPITILFFLKKIFRLSYQNAEWRSSTKCSPFLEAIASLFLSHSAFINSISYVFLSFPSIEWFPMICGYKAIEGEGIRSWCDILKGDISLTHTNNEFLYTDDISVVSGV